MEKNKCGECGKEVYPNEPHNFEDCLREKNKERCDKCNGTGFIIKCIKSLNKGKKNK